MVLRGRKRGPWEGRRRLGSGAGSKGSCWCCRNYARLAPVREVGGHACSAGETGKACGTPLMHQESCSVVCGSHELEGKLAQMGVPEVRCNDERAAAQAGEGGCTSAHAGRMEGRASFRETGIVEEGRGGVLRGECRDGWLLAARAETNPSQPGHWPKQSSLPPPMLQKSGSCLETQSGRP